MPDQELKMTFDPSTIQHLGLKMYSQIPAAIAELIANAYDADASRAEIKLYNGDDKKIVVSDDGMGMSFDEINDKFLKIGRNRREGIPNQKTAKGRFPSGKKGLGKLALFGLGNVITIQTKTKNNQVIQFSLDWSEIKNATGDYKPTYKITESSEDFGSGTTITISELKRSSGFDRDNLVNSIAKLFHYVDEGFEVSICVDDGEKKLLTAESKLNQLEVEFDWTDFKKYAYAREKDITGKVITSVKPLRAGMRGVALYARGRLVNLSEFFGNSDTSHFYAYATGILNVDFIDEFHGEEDLIATNRQALNWEYPVTQELKKFLARILIDIQTDWRRKRKEKASKKAKEETGIDRDKWLQSLPGDKRDIITELLGDEENDNATFSLAKVVGAIHEIAPEFAEFHWRYSHNKLKTNDRIETSYQKGRYYDVCDEAIKILFNECKSISEIYTEFEGPLIKSCFEVDKDKEPKMFLIEKHSEYPFIFENIQNGYCSLFSGILKAYRNVLSHNIEDITRNFISEKDCLDILSLISHLLSKLDNRVKP